MDAPRNFNVTTALRCNHRIAKDDEASLCLITAQYPRGALVSSPQVISTAKGASKPSPYGHRDLTGFWHFKRPPPPTTTFASLPGSASEKLPREPDSSLPPVLSL
ncbi:hypothetical protein BHE74_00016572 [Ensete ventricosum]|nr:hypothetical protein BHE74_00016572 [Ensete ventricosum]